MVEIHLTPEAAKKMSKSSVENSKKPLVVMVAGKVLAAMVVMNEISDYIPVAGNFSADEAQCVIKACK